jgi:hypothetical protein
MYFFVPYNISPIQQAIQAGHAALEYAWKFWKSEPYCDFMLNDKTWIILNGGTTNDTLIKDTDDGFAVTWKPAGTLNQVESELFLNKIPYANFREPDLNNSLTAICFLADERIWDWENYPTFRDYLWGIMLPLEEYPFLKSKRIKDFSDEELVDLFKKEHKTWLKKIGGKKNEFLKNLIRNKKLA